jgi:hypothetical protein
LNSDPLEKYYKPYPCTSERALLRGIYALLKFKNKKGKSDPVWFQMNDS